MGKSANIAAAVCAMWIAANTTGLAATVTMLHGSKTENFDTAKIPAGGVHIARPSGAAATIPNRMAPKSAISGPLTPAVFAAGNTLWTHDARTGGLTACTVWSSGMVGRDVIRCTAARPHARPYRRYAP